MSASYAPKRKMHSVHSYKTKGKSMGGQSQVLPKKKTGRVCMGK